jgi:beta-lactamase superfamily II metal-dependent hydrolase
VRRVAADETARGADAAPAARPRRPVVGLCAAVFAGSLCGAEHALEPEAAKVALAGCVLALLAAACLRGRARGRVVRGLVLAIVGLAASLRAAAVDERGDARASRVRAGVWSSSGVYADEERGQLEGRSPRYAVAPGILHDGETVAILAADGSRRWPRGPEPGPSLQGGVSAPASLVLPDELVRIAAPRAGPGQRVSTRLAELREAFLARCSGLREPLTRALVKALLFGDMSEMPHGVSDLFVRAGTYHVLAISGSQVGLVAMLILWPLSRVLAGLLRRASFRRVAIAPEIFHFALLLAFVPIAGSGAPVLRSAMSYALGASAPRARMPRPFARVRGNPVWVGRKADALSLWACALAFECLLHARAPLSISVQLSYAATLGLILGAGPILRWLRARLPGEARIAIVDALGRDRSAFWRVPVQRAVDVALAGVAASLAAVLATLPFVWARFGEWSPVGILATPALTLPMAVLLALSWVWLFLPWGVPQLLLDLPARAMVLEMQLFDALPGSPDPLPPRPLWLLLIATGLSFACVFASRSASRAPDRRTGARAAGRTACLAWAALLLPWALAPAHLELVVLDVGHGTSVALRWPGSATWLFDAGSKDRPDVAREALIPLLRRWESGAIAVALSHTDRDHDSALPYVIERYPPAVWAGALPAQCAERLPHTTLVFDAVAGRAEVPAASGSRESSRVILVRGSERAGNEGSRSMLIQAPDGPVLLCGDASGVGLAGTLAQLGEQGALRMLLFPHHGSQTDLVGALLAATRPGEIWISCSGEAPILPELARRGARCRTTARNGPLVLEPPRALAATVPAR